jgi:hypothetical protein
VYLPITLAFVTKTSILTPGRRRRSRRRTRTSFAVRARDRRPEERTCLANGQPRPVHLIEILAPLGASTLKSRTRVPEVVTSPEIRTTGKGLMSGQRAAEFGPADCGNPPFPPCPCAAPAATTVIARDEKATSPPLSVTRRPTTKEPARLKDR